MKKNIRWIAIIMACLLILTTAVGCSQQKPQDQQTAAPGSWTPEKAFEFLVPMGAGGGSDVFCRTLVKVVEDNKLSPQPIVVVNKPGGSGSIGWSYVANDHKGDPYEISTVSSSFYTGPLSGQSPVSYKDFTHIAALCEDPNLILVPTDSKYQTLQELIDDAKANPGKVSAGGSSGLSVDAITFYALEDASGADMKYVPFGGGGEVMTAIMGGHVTYGFLGPSEAAAQIEAGKLRALGVTTEERVGGDLKDVPTLKESGFDVIMAQVRGIVAPKEIPEEAKKYLEEMFLKAAETPEWKEFVAKNFMEENIMNSEEFTKQSEAQNEKFAKYLEKIEK
jgi:putative tricarboxylic transport membrane protein